MRRSTGFTRKSRRPSGTAWEPSSDKVEKCGGFSPALAKESHEDLIWEVSAVADDKVSQCRVAVSIFDQEYVVKSREEEAYVRELASYLDRKMREIHHKS